MIRSSELVVPGITRPVSSHVSTCVNTFPGVPTPDQSRAITRPAHRVGKIFPRLRVAARAELLDEFLVGLAAVVEFLPERREVVRTQFLPIVGRNLNAQYPSKFSGVVLLGVLPDTVSPERVLHTARHVPSAHARQRRTNVGR